MLIKIKLEPQSSKAFLLLKKISYFSIDDDATITDLKMKIEEFVNVPAERQEICTLVKVFQNSWFVKEVCDIRGSAIMLYIYDECHEFEEPQFVCFIQVYTNELAAQQQKLEERSKLPVKHSKTEAPNITSSTLVTMIADTDTDTESEDADTETSSSKSMRSNLGRDCSVNNYDSLCAKKRSKYEKNYSRENKKFKFTASSEYQYSETLCQHLDELPTCSKKADYTPNKKIQDSTEFTLLCKLVETEKLNKNENKILERTYVPPKVVRKKLHRSPIECSYIYI